MTYILATYWLPALLALALGVGIGYFTFARPGAEQEGDRWPGWLKALAAVFVVGLLVALFGWLPGGAGHYLETALLLLAAYIAGCFAGSWLAGRAADADTEQTAPAEPAVAAPAAAPAETETAPPSETGHPGQRPAAAADPGGAADDLKRISGIGPKNEKLLHGLGIYRFHQIAAWSEDNVRWVDSYLSFKGRIGREDWVGQAETLARETPATPPR